MKLIEPQHKSIEGNNAIREINILLLESFLKESLAELAEMFQNGEVGTEEFEESIEIEVLQLEEIDPCNPLLEEFNQTANEPKSGNCYNC